MVMAADLSVRQGLLDTAAQDRVTAIVAAAHLPVRAPALGAQRYVDLMSVDKKAEAGAVKFILLDGVGRAIITAVPDSALQATLAQAI